ncbi:class I mannose-6-phosphate isomerase [Microbacterium sp. NPDC058389]|uniref:class I mannose-6-phosphate isomerase n=1 Tax=Microbacterium sp. NPDC058389 TaxID=3346475 RepID=UPI00365E57D1
MTGLSPMILAPNRPARPYRGGEGIAALRGTSSEDDHRPEDFIASTVSIFGDDHIGLSTLPDGSVLKDAIAQTPEQFLGASHVDAFGAQPELLVKLLDTGERLFVHFHPDDAFAAKHLGLAHGKTEAWIVTAIRDAGPDSGAAYLGFARDVSAEEVADWVDSQNVPGMLAAMNKIVLRVGDAILVPAGVPHALGPGLTVVELQEPADVSVLLEFTGYPGVDRRNAFLDLDEATALTALDRSSWGGARLRSLMVARRNGWLLPPAADRFFRAERIKADGAHGLASGYAVLVVIDGAGAIRTSDSEIAVERGATVLVPFAAGSVELVGPMEVIRCIPPAVARRHEHDVSA